jgi:hypothetical protein
MATGPITRFVNDEQPDWVETITSNGVTADYSSGYTFTVTIINQAGTTLLTKTTGITGATGGQITVAFTGAELAAALVTATFAADNVIYQMRLTPRRTSDSSDGPTVKRTLVMQWRP